VLFQQVQASSCAHYPFKVLSQQVQPFSCAFTVLEMLSHQVQASSCAHYPFKVLSQQVQPFSCAFTVLEMLSHQVQASSCAFCVFEMLFQQVQAFGHVICVFGCVFCAQILFSNLVINVFLFSKSSPNSYLSKRVVTITKRKKGLGCNHNKLTNKGVNYKWALCEILTFS
jgi:hypothetical protein